MREIEAGESEPLRDPFFDRWGRRPSLDFFPDQIPGMVFFQPFSNLTSL